MKNNQGLNPITLAAFLNKFDFVKYLYQWTENSAENQDPDGYSPLWWAVLAKEFKLARLMLEGGADIDKKGAKGRTLLYEIKLQN